MCDPSPRVNGPNRLCRPRDGEVVVARLGGGGGVGVPAFRDHQLDRAEGDSFNSEIIAIFYEYYFFGRLHSPNSMHMFFLLLANHVTWVGLIMHTRENGGKKQGE